MVDDTRDTLLILRKILESNDYIVFIAENGPESMDFISRERPDLIITDYMMSGMDGLSLIKKIRSRLVTRNIPIIMITAKNEVDSEVTVIDAGADDYIVKPIIPKRLLARIKRLLNRECWSETLEKNA